MGKTKYYAVLDTETVTDARVPYDVGVTVTNRKGEKVEQFNALTQEIVGNKTGLYVLAKDSFAKHKAEFYFNLVDAEPEIIMPWGDIIDELWDIRKKYDKPPIVAYNARFDVGVMNRYSESLGYAPFFGEDSEIWDLWNIALHSLCNSRNYVEFALLNDFITEAGNVKSSAEAVFNYLMKDGKFEEAHTALADTEIEAKILQACFKRHKKLEKEYCKPMFAHPIWKERLKLS